MTRYRVGVIGTGDPDAESGFAMAYRHADAYRRLDSCELVACADIRRDRAEHFAADHGISGSAVFERAETLVAEANPDILSVCLPPAVHAEVVIDCVRAGHLQAIHCEKPMADTWGDALAMSRVCADDDVQLTFNHQRRFGPPIRRAKQLVELGAIGELQRVEFAASNLFDYGTHSIDLCQYFNDEIAPEWVLAGLDYREQNLWFGAHNENQAIVHWQYANGVDGLGVTGDRGGSLVGAHNRLVGSGGCIELGVQNGPTLRISQDGQWRTVETGEATVHGPDYVERAIAHVVDSLNEGTPSELDASHALRTTAVIFGAYESVRRRGRVDFPLRLWDNPLVGMVENGELAAISRPE